MAGHNVGARAKLQLMANVLDLYKAGLTHHQAGRLTEAGDMYRRVLQIDPNHVDGLHKLGLVCAQTGNCDSAIALLGKVIAQAPAYPTVHYTLGTLLEQTGDVPGAIAAYRRALDFDPDFALAHWALATASVQSGDLQTARTEVRKAIDLDPHNARFRLTNSLIADDFGDDRQIAELEGIDIENLPPDQQVQLHFALGAAHDAVGNYENAFKHWLAGNATKRISTTYDEAGTLAEIARMRRMFTPRVLQASRGNPSQLPVFIVGMPRSGTTLVEQILSSHPAVYGAGELTLLAELIRELPTEPGEKLRLSDFYELGTRYVERLQRPGILRVINKMPSNFSLLGYIHLALPQAQIIHMVRDPLDTCLSCFATLFHAGNQYTNDLTWLGRFYRAYQELMDHWHEAMPGRILDVRYEDVVTDLEGQARRIVAHCGLEWDPGCLEFHTTKRPVRTASAAQVRQPIYDKSIGRSKKYEAFLGPLLAELRLPHSI